MAGRDFKCLLTFIFTSGPGNTLRNFQFWTCWEQASGTSEIPQIQLDDAQSEFQAGSQVSFLRSPRQAAQGTPVSPSRREGGSRSGTARAAFLSGPFQAQELSNLLLRASST